MMIIGITSYDRCGKDTFANWLKNGFTKKGKNVKILHMAKPLKDVVSKMLSIEPGLLEKFKESDKLLGWGLDVESTRNVLIKTATALREVFGEDIFIKQLEDEILKNYSCPDDVVIIPDVRFLIEAKHIKDMGGIIIKLDSGLRSCGENGKKYEVDKIPYDTIVIVDEKGTYINMDKEHRRIVMDNEVEFVTKLMKTYQQD